MARLTLGGAARFAVLGLTVAGVLLTEASSASAQIGSARGRHSAAGGGTKAPVVFNAAEVTYDNELSLVVARGDVEITENGRTVLADTVTYNEKTDTVTASGHVSMIEETGEVIFADYVELTDQMRDAFIKDVRMLLADRSRLVANTARRLDSNRTELVKGVYSPCDLCKNDPTRPPLWQLKAAKITHDKEQQLVEYDDVVMEIAGVPIFYSPYLSHPDPSVKRRSGFLAPTIGTSSALGFNITTPYYWAIDRDKDLTFSPIFTANEGVVLAGEYRERFHNGYIGGKASITYGDLNTTTTTTPTAFRGNIDAIGRFDLDENYRTGFDLQRATDQTYLRRYRFGGTESFLTSRAYLENFDGRNNFSVNSYEFQPLIDGVKENTQPIVLPVFDYNWVGRPDAWGGRLSLNGNALNLINQAGADSHRLSTGGAWRRPFTTPDGSVFTFTGSARGDAYYVTDDQVTTNGPKSNVTTGRVFPQAALDWRYPIVRYGQSSSILIQPIAAVIAAPIGGNSAKIPNYDSVAFDFDDSELFKPNRFSGLDRVDGGQRVDYGLSAAIFGASGASASTLVGQSYRFQKSIAAFAQGTGLDRQQSDVVGRVVMSPGSYLDTYYRFRLDGQDLRARRQEIGLSAGPQRLKIFGNYSEIAANSQNNQTSQHQISGGLSVGVTPYWTVSLSGTKDLGLQQTTISSGVSATYQDECLTFITSFSQSGTQDRDVTPGTTILFQVVFKNIGQIILPALQTGTTSSGGL